MARAIKIEQEGLIHDLENEPERSEALAEERSDLDNEVERQIRLEKIVTLKEYNRTLAQNNSERKRYGIWIFRLTCSWAFLIFVIIFMQGFKMMSLSDQVLITLITSTTINFFGFFLLVVKYLFNTGTGQSARNGDD